MKLMRTCQSDGAGNMQSASLCVANEKGWRCYCNEVEDTWPTYLKFVHDIGQIYFEDNRILCKFVKLSQIIEKLFLSICIR